MSQTTAPHLAKILDLAASALASKPGAVARLTIVAADLTSAKIAETCDRVVTDGRGKRIPEWGMTPAELKLRRALDLQFTRSSELRDAKSAKDPAAQAHHRALADEAAQAILAL